MFSVPLSVGLPRPGLPGALPCGVRTFLSRSALRTRREATGNGYARQRSSGRLQQYIIAWALRKVPRSA